jgi:hypothetical protein
MPEQSIGMATGATSAFGDGNVGTGYPSARMTAMETKTLSEGVLQTGGLLAMTGNGTNTLTIASGAAIVDGYFYENTSSSAIVISTLANATYNVVIFVNETSGSLTVSRSVAGTTVGTYSVRLAVATSAQLVGQTYLQLGTVTISGAAITASGIVQNYAMYGTTSQLPYQAYASMGGGIATLTLANIAYDLSSFSSPTSSGEGLIVADNINNTMTVTRAGMYLITASCVFSSGTTGNRLVTINVNGINVSSTRAAAPGVASHTMTQTALHILAVSDVVKITMQTSLAGQSVASGLFNVVRV